MSLLPKMTTSRHARDFIDDEYLTGLANQAAPDDCQVHDILAKSAGLTPLTPEETAVLLAVNNSNQIEAIFDQARSLKKKVYGNRIVLFAPLYIGNLCVNDCRYCGFARSNCTVERRTLSPGDIKSQVAALEREGHKRLIMAFGEHPVYDAQFIADAVRTAYSVREKHGDIRRINVNAAPLDQEGYAIVKEAGIGTYQVFQETYHHATYRKVHPVNSRKGDYMYRLDSHNRAMEAGVDDVGIGALFGLHDWRFEVLAMVEHARFLQNEFGVGPHTISFPRLQPACGIDLNGYPLVSDENFKRLIAVLRLAIPYTGMILTARESAEIRREVMEFGVSQIDAGSRIELGGYTEVGDAQVHCREQFALGDLRSLDEIMRELISNDYLPSFCTACYRLGRTGEHFMEFAIPGFIEKFCTPNAMLTLTEYLEDFSSPETRQVGKERIEKELSGMEEGTMKTRVRERLDAIRNTEQRDLHF